MIFLISAWLVFSFSSQNITVSGAPLCFYHSHFFFSSFFSDVHVTSGPFCIQMIQVTSEKQNKLCVYNLVYVVLLQYIMVCHIDLAWCETIWDCFPATGIVLSSPMLSVLHKNSAPVWVAAIVIVV